MEKYSFKSKNDIKKKSNSLHVNDVLCSSTSSESEIDSRVFRNCSTEAINVTLPRKNKNIIIKGEGKPHKQKRTSKVSATNNSSHDAENCVKYRTKRRNKGASEAQKPLKADNTEPDEQIYKTVSDNNSKKIAIPKTVHKSLGKDKMSYNISMDAKGDYNKSEDLTYKTVLDKDSRQYVDTSKSLQQPDEDGVLYCCPEICSEVLSKDAWHERFRQYIELIRETDEILASIIAIKSLNSNKDVHDCLKILETYLRNLILHPNEEKYRQIRFENKSLQEKVLNVEGAGTFLTSIGFSVLENEEDKQNYFVYPYVVKDTEILEIIDLMNRAEGFKLTVDRCSKANPRDHKNLQKEEGVTKESSINKENELYLRRAKKIRNQKPKKIPSSNFTQIKVRLPNGDHFQGTFTIDEKLKAVKSFIDEKIQNFEDYRLLKPPAEPFTQLDYEKSLEQLELFPAVLLKLSWESSQTPKDKQDKLNRTFGTMKKRIKP